jgi:putative acetyltransferase
MTVPVLVRAERDDDHEHVRRLHMAAFGAEGRAVADLVDDMRRMISADIGPSLVAEEAGEVVGHAMFTRGILDAPRG